LNVVTYTDADAKLYLIQHGTTDNNYDNYSI